MSAERKKFEKRTVVDSSLVGPRYIVAGGTPNNRNRRPEETTFIQANAYCGFLKP